MPSGPRIRANNVFGSVVNNPLTAAGTTLNAVELALLPEVSAAHAILTLDPLRQNGEPEIVVVTAHSPGAQTATIVRGAYSTVARDHPAGTIWVHAPLDEDLIEIVESTARPTDPYDGQVIYESDTARFVTRVNSAWVGIIPTGIITQYGGGSAPAGWLMCDGAAVSRTTFADLFAVLGTEYGAGDGLTTFNLPNLRDRFPLGQGATFSDLGGTGGSATATATHVHSLNSHSHSLNSHTHGLAAHVHEANHDHTLPDHHHNTSNDGGHTHNSGFSGFIVQTGSTLGLVAGPAIQASGPVANTGSGGSAHNHVITDTALTTHTSVDNTGISSPNTSNGASPNNSGNAVGDTAGSSVGATNGNMPPYLILNYIVKV